MVSLTGTPYIPHLMAPNPKQFVFLSLSETRNTSPSTIQTIVPTQAQRFGDLTPAFQAGTVSSGTAYDPKTGQPFGNTNCLPALLAIDPTPTACVPQNELNPAAQALFGYYPLPNITATQTLDNYQANFPGSAHSSQVSGRYNRSFGATPTRGGRGGGGGGGRGGGGGGQNRNAPPALRQSIAENFAYSHSASAGSSFSPLLGGKSVSDGYGLLERLHRGLWAAQQHDDADPGIVPAALTSNNFTNGTVNPAVTAGIFVGNPTIYTNPFYFGVPSVSITGGIAGLSDTTPVNSINQTISFSEQARWSHKRHNTSYGFDVRRIHLDSIGTGGDLGSFTFSGFATENPALQACNPQTGRGQQEVQRVWKLRLIDRGLPDRPAAEPLERDGRG